MSAGARDASTRGLVSRRVLCVRDLAESALPLGQEGRLRAPILQPRDPRRPERESRAQGSLEKAVPEPDLPPHSPRAQLSGAALCEGAEAASHAPGARPPRSPPPTCLGWCPSWASREATLFPDRGFHVFRSKEASKSINAQRRRLGNTNGLAQRRSLRGRQRDVTVPGQSAHSRGRPSLRVAEGSMAGCRGTRLGTDSVLLHHVPVTHAKLHLEGRLKAHIRGPRRGGGRLGPQGRRAQCPGGFSPAPPRHLRPAVSLPGAAS